MPPSGPEYGFDAALQTSTSIRPKARLLSSTRFCRFSFDEMLAATATAVPFPYLSLISLATASQTSALREEITTLAPCSAMRSATARPMPRVEPVMTATFPFMSTRLILLSPQDDCSYYHRHSGATRQRRTRKLEIPRCAIAHLRSGAAHHPGMTI